MLLFKTKIFNKSATCFFDPSTYQRQSFSIPEKIVYYLAKNITNAETCQKLVKTCKYFYKVNPVIVVPEITWLGDKWYPCRMQDRNYYDGFKYDQPTNFKIWVTEYFYWFSGNASQLISSIYKNDAIVVSLRNKPLKFEEFLFFAGNAKELVMYEQLVHENSKIIQLEDIVKNLPKLKSLNFEPCVDGMDVNSNTVRKLMEIVHFKHLSQFFLCNVSAALNVEEMFNFIIENKHVEVDLLYSQDIPDACKELVQKYSNLLKKQSGCKSYIEFDGMDFDDENEDSLFPWKNEDDEEWELPWDQTEWNEKFGC